MQIGFLGAGSMSAPMIENLVADGHSVRVWNRTARRARALEGAGVVAVEQPAQVCTAGGVILSCLADDAALEAVFDDGSVLSALGLGGVHVSMSTISAACARHLAATHAAAHTAYVAAPVLGRPDAVRARMQSYIVAGAPAARERVHGLLAALGQKVFAFGDDPVAANVAKINFNFLIAASIEAMSEAFAVVEKAGLDPHAFHEMVTGTAFGCRIYEGYGRMIVDRAFDPALFRLVLGLKDVRLAQGMAAAVDARMRLGDLLESRYAEAVEHGLGEKDWTAAALEVRGEAGLS